MNIILAVLITFGIAVAGACGLVLVGFFLVMRAYWKSDEDYIN